MSYRIVLSRTWGCAHRNDPYIEFEAGTYDVPNEMPDHLAQRCLRSGLGKMVIVDEPPPAPKKRAPHNKMRGPAPENK